MLQSKIKFRSNFLTQVYCQFPLSPCPNYPWIRIQRCKKNTLIQCSLNVLLHNKLAKRSRSLFSRLRKNCPAMACPKMHTVHYLAVTVIPLIQRCKKNTLIRCSLNVLSHNKLTKRSRSLFSRLTKNCPAMACPKMHTVHYLACLPHTLYLARLGTAYTKPGSDQPL